MSALTINHSYTATFGHSEHDVPGRMTLEASTEAEAIAEANKFVESGFRSGTWINVSLEDGVYGAANRDGKAVGSITRY